MDGDTLWVRVDEPGSGALPAGAFRQVRLLEIDTPETKQPSKPVECWGTEATAFAEQVLPMGARVWLVADREDTDRYGRFLRYLGSDQGVFFNEAAVREGHARAVLYEPNDRYIETMRAAEAEAKAANRGMWGQPCDYDAPPPPPAPAPKPTSKASTPPPSSLGASGTYYANCTEAKAAGAAPLYRGDPGYRSALDRDNDGIACEK